MSQAFPNPLDAERTISRRAGSPARRRARRPVLAAIVVAAALPHAQLRATPIDPVRIENARIDWHQVSAPFGRFLLLKGERGTCAIRFIDFERAGDAPPATAFRSGDERMSSRYEWYFAPGAVRSFADPGVRHGTGTVRTGPLVGIGRLAVQTVSPVLTCGPMKAFWIGPGALSFSDRVSCKRATHRIAPTGWDTVGAIVADDPRLRWFGCDEHRKTLLIPLGEL